MDATYVELQEKLGQPEVASNPDEFREISKSIAQMKEPAEGYRKFIATEEALEEARYVRWQDSPVPLPPLPLPLLPHSPPARFPQSDRVRPALASPRVSDSLQEGGRLVKGAGAPVHSWGTPRGAGLATELDG